MRWTRTFLPTLRDDPVDAEAASHRLLVRAGFVRQLMSGVYSLLPLGVRVAHGISRRKLELAFAAFLAVVALRFLFSLAG